MTRRAMELIKHNFRADTGQAFWEHAVAGKPAPLVARNLGTTPGAVSAAKVRVLARLRQELSALLTD